MIVRNLGFVWEIIAKAHFHPIVFCFNNHQN